MHRLCTVDFGSDERMVLEQSILIYSNQHTAYATVHNIATDKAGRASLMAGTPLTHATIANLVSQFSDDAQVGSFLPANVLSVGLDSLVWWVKPANRSVFFRCGEGTLIAEESAVVPHPSLIFGVKKGIWFVFAVKGDSRPEADTELCQAPHFNVWSDGKICVGNVDIPKGYGIETMAGWQDAYFNSTFTHPNVHTPAKLVEYEGGSYQFWRDMLDRKYSRFPEEVLVPRGNTVSQFIKKLNAGGLR